MAGDSYSLVLALICLTHALAPRTTFPHKPHRYPRQCWEKGFPSCSLASGSAQQRSNYPRSILLRTRSSAVSFSQRHRQKSKQASHVLSHEDAPGHKAGLSASRDMLPGNVLDIPTIGLSRGPAKKSSCWEVGSLGVPDDIYFEKLSEVHRSPEDYNLLIFLLRMAHKDIGPMRL